MNSILLSLKQQLQAIADLIVNKEDVIYLDYPLHLNVGDLLIYAGTEQFFKDYQISVKMRRCVQDFDLQEITKQITPNTTILCHGGGNFGDLYPIIQKMREDVVQAFPHNRIILLPQTAYFSNEQAMQKSAQIFSTHEDLHLFARDSKTLEMMKNYFSPNAKLSPDMAHQLYGVLELKKLSDSKEQKLYFLRKDIEKSYIEAEIQATLPNLDNVKDWEDILLPTDLRFELWCSRFAKVANKFKLSFIKNIINRLWYRRAMQIIERCRQIFVSYDEVVTSRLHGHIFSCLVGESNQVCDNSYGKNSGYYHQWTQGVDYAKLYNHE